NPQIMTMAKRLGLRTVPPVCVTATEIERLLRIYGPLWVNCWTHIVVIAGINTFALSLKVYDPAPVKVGSIGWRSFTGWYEWGSDPKTRGSARDTSEGVRATFLYIPRQARE